MIATFDDAAASPAIVEQPLGKGRAIVVTTSADAEWTTWPSDPSYLVTMLELARHAMSPVADEGSIGVGEPFRRTLDPSRYASTVRVEPPGSTEAAEVQALPSEDAHSLLLQFDDTARQGIYRVELPRRDGSTETEHVAANVDAREGDLRPAGRPEVAQLFSGSRVEVVAGRQFLSRGASGARVEVWRAMLFALIAALCIEQGLAWWFGSRRT